MNIYIWEYLGKVSDRWHPEGGLVVIAGSLERAKELAIDAIIDEEPTQILETNATEEKVYTFPDSGCC